MQAETDEGESASTRYILGYGVAGIERNDIAGLHAYHLDEQNSTSYVTGAGGEVESSYEYDAFGAIRRKSEEIKNRILYTGQQYDQETGQYYLRARFYNPVVGRFLQEDVYRGDGLNLYAYCGNNPVNYHDPSGYKAKKAQDCKGDNKNTTKGSSGNENTTSATQRRNSSGIVTGGKNNQDSRKMLRGTEGNVGVIPKEISDSLSGRTYDNFKEFRKDFWKEVSNSSYANEFMINGDMTNIYRMRNGGATLVVDSQVISGSVTYQIHHKTPINQGGEVFNLNNLLVVTPRYHAEILLPEYHGYNGFKKYFK